MSKLVLHFSDSGSPELYRIVFHHPAFGPQRLAVRGKGTGVYQYSFQWTQAVKALAVLFLESAAKDSSFSRSYVLEGENGSLASSLDYSIAKNTQWLVDVFGEDSNGRPLAKRLFKRSNADRKFAGPVGISINTMLWENIEFNVLLGENEVSPNEYLNLAAAIQKVRPVTSSFNIIPRTEILDLSVYLKGIYETEFRAAMYRTDIFNTEKLNSALASISQAGFYRKISGTELKLPKTNISPHSRLGLGIDYENAKAILAESKIITPSTLIGPIILFHYLLNEEAFNFDYNCSYAHAVGMVSLIIKGQILPDVLCAGIAPAATLIGSKMGKEYVPLMLMPDSSQKIIAHKSTLLKNRGLDFASYTYLKDEPSIPSFMLDELESIGKLSKKKVKLHHSEPDESFAVMMQGDPELRAALFFPHYNFNCEFNNCVALPDLRSKTNSQEVILLVHREKANDMKFVQTLEAVIRDTWLEMRLAPNLIKESINSLLEPEGSSSVAPG